MVTDEDLKHKVLPSNSKRLGLFIQPACLQHRYIRHANASHIFERPERLRAVLLGVSAGVARLEQAEESSATEALVHPPAQHGLQVQRAAGPAEIELSGGSTASAFTATQGAVSSSWSSQDPRAGTSSVKASRSGPDDLSSLLSSLSVHSPFTPPRYLNIVPPPPAGQPGQILLHHPALQLSHSPPTDSPFPYTGLRSEKTELPAVPATPATIRLDSPAKVSSPSRTKVAAAPPSLPSSEYLKNLYKWASESVERIKETGCEIPSGMGLNQGDLYLAPGSILAIEGAIQTVCQAIDRVCSSFPSIGSTTSESKLPQTPPSRLTPSYSTSTVETGSAAPSSIRPDESFSKAFCCIRPPGHHCGEDTPSGFCYVNNVVVGAMHAYLKHDVDRAIIIDFDLHHGNGTQALVMPLNAASHAEDLARAGGKPPSSLKGKDGRPRRGWKGFYGSVHDIYSYPCEDGDLDLIKDASLSLAAHGQYIENIHLQPYSDEADFYARIYPQYLALLDKARTFMRETQGEPGKTVIFISAGFDACEHEHQGMQRHDRRVPTSFFERYTRDIVRFAEEHAEGKVVSVLEGGYSDKALMSAAMGHVVGLLDKSGKSDWWSESELANIEKATRKKRTGKLAPFPPELSSIPYLLRTHALLGHFESLGPDASSLSVAHPMAVSAQATPQPPSRMTLRNRTPLSASNSAPEIGENGLSASGSAASVGPPGSDALDLKYVNATGVPGAAARRGRGRGAAPTSATPRKVTVGATPLRKQAAQAQALTQGAPPPLPTLLTHAKISTPSKIPLPPSERNTPVQSGTAQESAAVKMEQQLSSDELADVSLVLATSSAAEQNGTPSRHGRSQPAVPISALLGTPQTLDVPAHQMPVTPPRNQGPTFGVSDPPYNPLASLVGNPGPTQHPPFPGKYEGMQHLGTIPASLRPGAEGDDTRLEASGAVPGGAQKIFLRIRRPTPVGPQAPPPTQEEVGVELEEAEDVEHMETDMDWREASAETTSSASVGEGYVSARSDISKT